MTSPSQHFRTECRAFSLIEVVLAIAIVTFALLAIVGAIPVGLQTMRESQTDQATGMIANQLRGELQQISFGEASGSGATITELATTNYYYTVEGVKTDLTSSAGSPYYHASFGITNAAINGTAFGGSTSTPTNSATVTVILTYPYPALVQTNEFSLLATRQEGL